MRAVDTAAFAVLLLTLSAFHEGAAQASSQSAAIPGAAVQPPLKSKKLAMYLSNPSPATAAPQQDSSSAGLAYAPPKHVIATPATTNRQQLPVQKQEQNQVHLMQQQEQQQLQPELQPVQQAQQPKKPQQQPSSRFNKQLMPENPTDTIPSKDTTSRRSSNGASKPPSRFSKLLMPETPTDTLPAKGTSGSSSSSSSTTTTSSSNNNTPTAKSTDTPAAAVNATTSPTTTTVGGGSDDSTPTSTPSTPGAANKPQVSKKKKKKVKLAKKGSKQKADGTAVKEGPTDDEYLAAKEEAEQYEQRGTAHVDNEQYSGGNKQYDSTEDVDVEAQHELMLQEMAELEKEEKMERMAEDAAVAELEERERQQQAASEAAEAEAEAAREREREEEEMHPVPQRDAVDGQMAGGSTDAYVQGVKMLPEPESVMNMLQNSKYMLVLVPVSKGEGGHKEGPPGGSLQQERHVESYHPHGADRGAAYEHHHDRERDAAHDSRQQHDSGAPYEHERDSAYEPDSHEPDHSEHRYELGHDSHDSHSHDSYPHHHDDDQKESRGGYEHTPSYYAKEQKEVQHHSSYGEQHEPHYGLVKLPNFHRGQKQPQHETAAEDAEDQEVQEETDEGDDAEEEQEVEETAQDEHQSQHHKQPHSQPHKQLHEALKKHVVYRYHQAAGEYRQAHLPFVQDEDYRLDVYDEVPYRTIYRVMRPHRDNGDE